MIELKNKLSGLRKKMSEQTSKFRSKEAFVTAYQIFSICNQTMNYLITTNNKSNGIIDIGGFGKLTGSELPDGFRSLLGVYLYKEKLHDTLNIASGLNIVLEEMLNRLYDTNYLSSYSTYRCIYDTGNIVTYKLYPDFGRRMIPVASLVSQFAQEESNTLITISKFRVSPIVKRNLNMFSITNGDVHFNGKGLPKFLNVSLMELLKLYHGTDERSFFTMISMYSERVENTLTGIIPE